MKNKKKILWALIIVLFSLPLFIYLVRPYSSFIMIFLPPADLYEPRILEPISLGEEKTLFELPLKHDYVGSYMVGVFMENIPASSSTPIKSNAVLRLKITAEGKTLLEKDYSDWSFVFGAPGKENSGVGLDTYQVPENIPIKLNLKAQLSVVSPDPTFEHRYGKAEFFIRRFLNQ